MESVACHLIPVDFRHEAGVVLAGLAHLGQGAPVGVVAVVDLQILNSKHRAENV